MQDEFLTMDEVAQYLKLSKSTVYSLTRRGRIPCCKIGKQLRFRRSSIDNWATEREKKRGVEHRRKERVPSSV